MTTENTIKNLHTGKEISIEELRKQGQMAVEEREYGHAVSCYRLLLSTGFSLDSNEYEYYAYACQKLGYLAEMREAYRCAGISDPTLIPSAQQESEKNKWVEASRYRKRKLLSNEDKDLLRIPLIVLMAIVVLTELSMFVLRDVADSVQLLSSIQVEDTIEPTSETDEEMPDEVVRFKYSLKDTKSEKHDGDDRIQVSNATASSSLVTYSGTVFGPELACDGNMDTTWQEGDEGYGIGNELRLEFYKPAMVSRIDIWSGKQESEAAFLDNGRLKYTQITIEFGEHSAKRYGVDTYTIWTTFKDERLCRCIELREKAEIKAITIVISSVYEGRKYQDTNIAEVAFY